MIVGYRRRASCVGPVPYVPTRKSYPEVGPSNSSTNPQAPEIVGPKGGKSFQYVGPNASEENVGPHRKS